MPAIHRQQFLHKDTSAGIAELGIVALVSLNQPAQEGNETRKQVIQADEVQRGELLREKRTGRRAMMLEEKVTQPANCHGFLGLQFAETIKDRLLAGWRPGPRPAQILQQRTRLPGQNAV